MSKAIRSLCAATLLLLGCATNNAVASGRVPAAEAQVAVGNTKALVPVLAYHNVLLTKDEDEQRESVTIDSLSRQFAWLAAKGYTPITVGQLLRAAESPESLPSKPILLTFDDGFESTYTHVLPLLRAYQWPALVAVVGSWVEAREANDVPASPGQPRFMNKQQIRELNESGLIEFASHTFDLHHGLQANAWNNQQPAAVTRAWADSRLESDAQWDARVRSDIARNQEYIRGLTGKAPQALVWPYGRYNDALKVVSKQRGLAVLFTLDDGISDVTKGLGGIRRHLITREEMEGDLASVLEPSETATSPVRAVRLKVSELAEPLPGEAPTKSGSAGASMSEALNKLLAAGGNTLILDPFERVDDKVVTSYFPNSVLPLARDYANRVVALASGKAGYLTWLTVSLNTSAYKGLTKPQILQLVEDAAKAMPLAGVVIENAQQVEAAELTAIGKRIATWRSSPTIVLDWKGPVGPQAMQTAKQAGAQYVIADPGALSEAVQDRSSLVVDVGASALEGVHAAARAGYVNFSFGSIPPATLDWLTAFSLRGRPLQRVLLPEEVSVAKGIRKD